FDAAELIDAADAVGATFAFVVPTQVGRLVSLGRPAPASLRALIVAGAPFPPAVKLRALEWLGPHRLWEFYGSAEARAIPAAPPARPGPPGWVGTPPPGVDVALDGDGGVLVRSAACMQGYLGEPEVPPGGFVAVGDIARRAGDGGLVLVDRKGDVVISGGVN